MISPMDDAARSIHSGGRRTTRSIGPRSLFTLALLAFFGVPAGPAFGQQPRTMSYADFAALRSVSDPQLSPDGSTVLYTVRVTSMDANRKLARTFTLPTAGGTPRPWPDDSVRATEARWSPTGTLVAYVADGQLWIARADGSSPRRVTALSGGATGPVWAPSGDRIAFTSTVWPECSTDSCNAEHDKAKEANKLKAHIADQLLFRHWNAWDEGTRSHLFVVDIEGGDASTEGRSFTPRDLMPGARYDVPVPPFGGSEGYAFSPDGKEIAYTAKDATRDAAWTTDLNVYVVSSSGGAPEVITRVNKAADQNPVYSPDGKYIAYAAQLRPGFESDRWRMMLYDRSARASREILPAWDRWAESYFFAPDSRTIYIGAGDRGRDRLFAASLAGGASSRPVLKIASNNNTAFSLAKDGNTLVWLRDAAQHPAEIWTAKLASDGLVNSAATVHPSGSVDAVGAPRQLTHENDALLAQLSLPPAEDFWFAGAKGDSLHGFIVKPPRWRAGEKYPVVLLIHGGPQGAWLDSWSSRWNYELFAATGAAVVAINPRGSTGYGQRITDEVTKDWGGKAYEDLMKGLDAALRRNPWMDSTRMAAAGGSFGGYMVNWIAGHTNRFKALVSHAGVFNLENMYGATEEIWFSEWEYGGPFWDPKAMNEQYRKFSPHLYAKNFKTPTLVIHGELDYRIPYSEGLSLFSVLQRQNVPSRLIVYPDEGHWILKPQNHRLWMNEVQSWIEKWLNTPKTTS